MEIWYHFLNTVIPFSWNQYDFMKNALAAVLLITPLYGILSTMIVNNRMAFFSDALGHSALTGIAIGVLLGLNNPLISMLGFSAFLAFVILVVKNKSASSTDTVIGVFSATAVALGIVLLSQGGGFSKYSNYLIGDLLSITPSEIILLAFIFIGVVLMWVILFNSLLLVGLNHSLARSRGLPVQWVEIIFAIVMALIVAISIQWVGILIINALLVLPAAAARNVTYNVIQYHIVSICIAIFSGITGLLLSYYWETATGATIVLVAAAIYSVTLFMKSKWS